MAFSRDPLQEAGLDRHLNRPPTIDPADTAKALKDLQTTVQTLSFLRDRSIGTESILPRYTKITQAALTLTIGHFVVSVDTTSNAVTVTLPNAQTVLGTEYIIYLTVHGTGHDLTVNTDGTDAFAGASSATGTHAAFSSAGNFLHLIAADNDVWLVLNSVGASFS